MTESNPARRQPHSATQAEAASEWKSKSEAIASALSAKPHRAVSLEQGSGIVFTGSEQPFRLAYFPETDTLEYVSADHRLRLSLTNPPQPQAEDARLVLPGSDLFLSLSRNGSVFVDHDPSPAEARQDQPTPQALRTNEAPGANRRVSADASPASQQAEKEKYKAVAYKGRVISEVTTHRSPKQGVLVAQVALEIADPEHPDQSLKRLFTAYNKQAEQLQQDFGIGDIATFVVREVSREYRDQAGIMQRSIEYRLITTPKKRA